MAKSVEHILSEAGSAFCAITHGGILIDAPDDLSSKQKIELMSAAILSSGLHAIAESIQAVANQLERLVDEGVTVYSQELDE